jgi:hypothetical protein
MEGQRTKINPLRPSIIPKIYSAKAAVLGSDEHENQ